MGNIPDLAIMFLQQQLSKHESKKRMVMVNNGFGKLVGMPIDNPTMSLINALKN